MDEKFLYKNVLSKNDKNYKVMNTCFPLLFQETFEVYKSIEKKSETSLFRILQGIAFLNSTSGQPPSTITSVHHGALLFLRLFESIYVRACHSLGRIFALSTIASEMPLTRLESAGQIDAVLEELKQSSGLCIIPKDSLELLIRDNINLHTATQQLNER